MSVIRTTVDENLFLSASDILATLGLDMNSAVRMFLQGVVLHNGIPFDLRLTEAQAQALRQRKQTNRQPPWKPATLPARAAPAMPAYRPCWQRWSTKRTRTKPDGWQKRAQAAHHCLHEDF